MGKDNDYHLDISEVKAFDGNVFDAVKGGATLAAEGSARVLEGVGKVFEGDIDEALHQAAVGIGHIAYGAASSSLGLGLLAAFIGL